jgi:hypothetical protein
MANTHINQFIQSLSVAEIKLVEDHLQKSRSVIANEDGEEMMELKLFKLLISNKNKNITDEEIIKATHTKRAASLKTNLYQKVLEAFSFDKHITNTDLFNEYDSISFKLKKKLLIFKILHRSSNQGKTEAMHELLNEIIHTAKEYEVYDVLTEALTAKKYFKGIRSGVKEFETINSEIDYYSYCTNALYYAADCYYRLILNNDFIKSFQKNEFDKYLDSCIKKMESDYKKTKSEQINYYFNVVLYALCEREKKYLNAIEYCNKIISMLKKSKIIHRKERVGFLFDDISRFKTYIGDYETGAIDAKKAQSYYLENSFNYIISMEQEFYAHIYGSNEHQALRCIEKLLEHSLIDTGEFRKSKYVYYKSCVLFSSGNYKAALDLLKMSLDIEQDKTRWNISLRILNIMIFIELNRIDDANRALESLRKHVERQAKAEEVKARDVLIVKVLRELEKSNFEFSSKNTNVVKMLKELSEKDTPVSWEHYSTELVPFHKWLEGKKKL